MRVAISHKEVFLIALNTEQKEDNVTSECLVKVIGINPIIVYVFLGTQGKKY